MEFHFSNSLSDVKLCEYYRKKWPKIKTFVFFSNFKNWIIWRMKHSKREIQSKVTSRPSIARIHGYIIGKLIFSTFHRRTLREVKVETLSQTWKYFLFRKFFRKLRKSTNRKFYFHSFYARHTYLLVSFFWNNWKCNSKVNFFGL